MRILKNQIDPKRHNGFVLLVPIDEEDVWYCYNIIVPGDILRLKTMRKVVHQVDSSSVKTAKRRLITMTVKVFKVTFQADEKGTSLLLKTRNLTDNEFVMKGQTQTIEVKLMQKLQVIKDYWNPTTLQFLEESADSSKNVDSVVVLLDEGYAAFYTLKRNFIKLHGKVTRSMPKKKSSIMDIYNKKVEEFDAAVWKYLIESFNGLENIKAVILAGPGNVRTRVFEKLKAIDAHEKSEVLRKAVRLNIFKFASIQTSSTFKSAISEIMKDKTGAKLLEDTKAVREVRKLEEFYNTLIKNTNMAVFGEREVRYALEQNAISSLLITDGLIRARNFNTRKKMTALVEQVREIGAEVLVFNENHDSGARLKDITGIAAILRFPVDLEMLNEIEAEPANIDSESENEEQGEEPELEEELVQGGDLFLDGDD